MTVRSTRLRQPLLDGARTRRGSLLPPCPVRWTGRGAAVVARTDSAPPPTARLLASPQPRASHTTRKARPGAAPGRVTQGGSSMLVLTRRLGEEIVIDGDVRVTVVAVQGDKIRLGVTAPKCVTVDRAEVHARRDE